MIIFCLMIPEINTFNLGTGKGTSVLELLSVFQKLITAKYLINMSNAGGRCRVCFADNTKAKKIMNWHPKKSIDEMCRDGWKWNLSNPNGYV